MLLRTAIGRYPGTLRDLSAALAAEGVARSAASLSAYQRGVALLPSGKWLYTLDRVLGVESGTFRAAVGSTAAPSSNEPEIDAETVRLRAKIWELAHGRMDNCVVTAVRDDVYVDEHGRPARIEVELALQADEDDVAEYWVIVSADATGARSDIRDARGCKVGHKIVLEDDRSAFQLIFDKLRAGGRCRIRFTLVHRFPGPAKPFHRRCVPGHWIGDLVIRVHFIKPPRVVSQSEWSLRSESPNRRPANVTGRTVLMHRPAPAPGTYGIDWQV